MGISNIVQRAATKGANKIAKLASLSPEELNKMAEYRDEYLSQSPDPTDLEALEWTGRLLAENSVEIYNAYLPQIELLYSPVNENVEFNKPFDIAHNTRYFKINKWVIGAEENNLEKLVNVYAVLSKEECNIALIFHRKKRETNVYLAITNTKNANNNTDVDAFKERLNAALRGNFPGAEWSAPLAGPLPCFDEKASYSVAAATNIPTEKSEKFISQTIEKLLDGNIPESIKQEYTLILLATPVQNIEERKLRLASLYSGLAPYAGWTTGFTYHQSDSTTSMATFGVNAGVSAGIQNGRNQSSAVAHGDAHQFGDTRTEQTMDTVTQQQSQTIQDGSSHSASNTQGVTNSSGTSSSDSSGTANSIFGSVTLNGEVSIPGVASYGGALTGGGSHGWNQSHADSVSEQIANSVTDTITQGSSHSVAETIGNAMTSSAGQAVAKTVSDTVSKTFTATRGVSKAVNFGGNFGANFARSSNVSATVGKDESITQTFTNYTIKHTLEIIEKQMKRYEQSVALGMWDFAAYVMSEDYNIANNVAHSYLALTQGEESYLSQSSVNLWRGDNEESGSAREICRYLYSLRHPVFGLNPYILNYDRTYSIYPAIVTATTSLSGKELAYSLNLPTKSVVGFPVIQCSEFARNVVRYDTVNEYARTINLGRIFHMHRVEDVPVDLFLDSLTSHTFITGSTGSGKSNTVYRMLDQAVRHNTKFMVIEPAKGEYKNVFGSLANVSVYGTNPKLTPLLKLNPFSFPGDIHVLEHLDRLVEIFNVCWPMYAAMPAVLKNAIEKSYEDCGWNLATSENEYGPDLYPSFADVARNVKAIIDSSEYDSENKGAYKGSLLTRLQSLTNGINGLIFSSEEIEPEDLFEENVIVDLSRVGSSETKSLLMGILIIKLQEYRMSSADSFNNSLKHLTVLEEAHNLLKRTSTEQPVEGGNLLGKSVEMLANAIAEMRTYGEGFIIADQAPGLLDMSVIRNTNTKIIMRLPDENDRQIVGKAANLNDDQITELSKLPLGVGAVYQNDMVQPVLCKIERYHYEPFIYRCEKQNEYIKTADISQRLHICELLSSGTRIGREAFVNEIQPVLSELQMSAANRVAVTNYLENPPASPRMTKIAPIAAELFPEILSEVSKAINRSKVESDWTAAANTKLLEMTPGIDAQVRRDIIQAVITYQFLNVMNDANRLRDWSMKGKLV